MSVIVFSKDRPMQLHAYIESLLRFSDVQEKDIAVLYAFSENISYDKVINSFRSVHWICEANFYDDLMSLLSEASDYVMFGCDDVVFKNNFSLKEAQEFLQKNDDVFGFSFRLGRNIDMPSNCTEKDNCLVWNWTTADTLHYNYPWELDCTLYRKSDVLSIIEQGRTQAYAPNPLEGIVTMNPEGYITRHNLACCNSDSKAIVITVNRVQDIAKNSFDGHSVTAPSVLAGLYSNDDVRINIDTIARMSNDKVHVGLEYFVLTNGYSFVRKKQKPSMKHYIRQAVRICARSINFAGEKITGKKYIVQKIYRRIIKRSTEIMLAYYFADKSKFPVILSPQDSLNMLKNNLMSFCRNGDGELILTGGGEYPVSEI